MKWFRGAKPTRQLPQPLTYEEWAQTKVFGAVSNGALFAHAFVSFDAMLLTHHFDSESYSGYMASREERTAFVASVFDYVFGLQIPHDKVSSVAYDVGEIMSGRAGSRDKVYHWLKSYWYTDVYLPLQSAFAGLNFVLEVQAPVARVPASLGLSNNDTQKRPRIGFFSPDEFSAYNSEDAVRAGVHHMQWALGRHYDTLAPGWRHPAESASELSFTFTGHAALQDSLHGFSTNLSGHSEVEAFGEMLKNCRRIPVEDSLRKRAVNRLARLLAVKWATASHSTASSAANIQPINFFR